MGQFSVANREGVVHGENTFIMCDLYYNTYDDEHNNLILKILNSGEG